jgi:hypothetical protein
LFAANEAYFRLYLINDQTGKCDQPAKRATKWASTSHQNLKPPATEATTTMHDHRLMEHAEVV